MNTKRIIKHTTLYDELGVIGYHFHGEGSPIFCFHGFGGSGLDFEVLADSLNGDRALIALNLPGHGGRPANEVGRDSILDFMRSHAHAPFRVMGYSMGGRFSLRIAVEGIIPIEKLCLIGTTAGLRSESERRERQLFEAKLAQNLSTLSPTNFQDWWSNLGVIASQQKMPNHYRENMHQRRLSNDLNALQMANQHWGTLATPSLWSGLNHLSHEVCLIVGDADTKYAQIAEEMSSLLPFASISRVPDAGHAPHFESPARTAAIIRSFFD